MARVQPSSSDGVSRPAPPNLTTYFISGPPRLVSFETFRFGPTEHDVQILHGLRGRALQQVIKTTDDDGAAAVGGQLEADIGIVGAHRVLNLRQRLVVDADHWTRSKELRKDAGDGCRRLRISEE